MKSHEGDGAGALGARPGVPRPCRPCYQVVGFDGV
jgi:hypothetical protein